MKKVYHIGYHIQKFLVYQHSSEFRNLSTLNSIHNDQTYTYSLTSNVFRSKQVTCCTTDNCNAAEFVGLSRARETMGHEPARMLFVLSVCIIFHVTMSSHGNWPTSEKDVRFKLIMRQNTVSELNSSNDNGFENK